MYKKTPFIMMESSPEKPLNSYFLYSKETRRSMKQQYPHLANAEITSLLAKQWRELPEDVKGTYVQRSKLMREVRSPLNFIVDL